MTSPEDFALTAKLFLTGDSQAVCLPAGFDFEGAAEVYIWRDAATGNVVLSRRPRPKSLLDAVCMPAGKDCPDFDFDVPRMNFEPRIPDFED